MKILTMGMAAISEMLVSFIVSKAAFPKKTATAAKLSAAVAIT